MMVVILSFYLHIYRVYMGRNPSYLVTDLDLIKQILVKEFSKFTNRPLAVSGFYFPLI